MARIIGTTQLQAALKASPAVVREEATKEVRASANAMRARVMDLLASAASYAPLWHGQPGMLNLTGKARRNYRVSVVKDGMEGKVGLLTPAAEKATPELRWFFFGTVHQPSRNAHSDAFETERGPFMIKQEAALERALARLG